MTIIIHAESVLYTCKNIGLEINIDMDIVISYIFRHQNACQNII